MKGLQYLLVVLVLSACSEYIDSESSSSGSMINEFNAEGEKITSSQLAVANSDEVILSGISYKVNGLSAFNYLQRKGEHIQSADLGELKKESVFMLEFESSKSTQNLFESEEMEMSKDDAVQYLVGDVLEDFTIKQNGKEFIPTGAFYEGQLGGQNRIRITFFAKGINLKQDYQIVYYDRLFGKGIVKIKKNAQEIIS